MLDRCFLCCRIQLTQGKVALVDSQDWVVIQRKGWRAKLSRGGWYAYKITRVRGKDRYTYMHRLVANTPKGKVCHHKNRNGLDNRGANLQNMTETEHSAISRMLRIAKTHGIS